MIKLDLELFGVIPNNMIVDKGIPNEAVVVYVTLRTLCFDVGKNCSEFTLCRLFDIFNVDSARSKQTKPIVLGIKYLLDNNYIQLHDIFYEKVDFDPKVKASYKVSFLLEDDNNCIDCEGGMTKIPEENMLCLLKYIYENKGVKKYTMVRFYLLIARGCSNSSQMWQLSQRYFNKTIGIAKSTVADWNEILQDLGIIFYSNTNCDAGESNSRNYATVYFHARNGVGVTKEKFLQEASLISQGN